MRLFIDIETRSLLDLTECGLRNYAAHDSTEILCIAYKTPAMQSPRIWIKGESKKEIISYLKKADTLIAHNAQFERIMLAAKGFINRPTKDWLCTAARARYNGLPGKLEHAAIALNLQIKKDMDGHAAMLKLCKPRKPTKTKPGIWWYDYRPDLVEKLHNYCKQDVVVSEEIYNMTDPLSDFEKQVWLADQETNDRGVGVDVQAAKWLQELLNKTEENLNKKVGQIAPGLNIKSHSELKAKLAEFGTYTDSVSKQTVKELLETELSNEARTLLHIRKESGKSSTAKINKLLDYVCADGRLRDTLIYMGAWRTGRWAGAGVQLQNMPRGEIPHDLVKKCLFKPMKELVFIFGEFGLMEFISSAIRVCFIGDLQASDFKSIEARCLLWLADDRDGLELYRNKQDPYVDMAAFVFRKKQHQITKEERFIGKQLELGSGYGMGGRKFVYMCAGYGVHIPEDRGNFFIDAYRKKRFKVVQLWSAIEKAAINAVQNPGKIFKCGKISFRMKGTVLFCRLPSGRDLYYQQARVTHQMTPWGEMKPALMHLTQNVKTKLPEVQSTYGGKLVENITQAIARELMAIALVNAKTISVLTVHDELLCDSKKKYNFEKYMASPPEWALDLPLEIETWVGNYYKK